MWRGALELAPQAVTQCTNADRGDGRGRASPCLYGLPARHARRRAKSCETALGARTLERAWYQCRTCGKGFVPVEAVLGLAGISLSSAGMHRTAPRLWPLPAARRPMAPPQHAQASW